MESVKTPFSAIWRILREEWNGLDWNSLSFGRYDEAVLAAAVLVSLIALALFVGYSRRNSPGRTSVVLPGILPHFKSSSLSAARYIPILLYFVGLVFFAVAFADPFLRFVKEETPVRGQKIMILVDSSGSMSATFRATKINKRGQDSYYTSVSAAEMFVKFRIDKGYNDLMGFILFGNESYVITPFTPDYRNILTSISLMGEPEEYARFPDKGTKIAQSLDQALQLFISFGFINASGNVIVLFSDGEDNEVIWEGKSISDILAGAKQGKIPVYFVRVRSADYNTGYQYRTYDEQWKNAIEASGGKLYFADDEDVIMKAVEEIDSNVKGEIITARYVSKRPYFLLFLALALAFWAVASVLALSKLFSRFP